MRKIVSLYTVLVCSFLVMVIPTIILVILIEVFPIANTTQLPDYELCNESHFGQRFTMVFLENNFSSLSHVLEVYPASKYPREFGVTLNWSNPLMPTISESENFQIKPHEQKVIDVPNVLQMAASEKSTKGIYIEASEKIGVYAMNKDDNTCDGFTVLPNHLLGTEHYAVCFFPHDKQNVVAFVATEDGTNVTFTLRAHTRPGVVIIYNYTYFRSGSVMKFYLLKGEAVHLNSSSDLTGCKIQSDKPIAVFSGTDLTRVHSGNLYQTDVNFTWAMNHLAEQIPDISHWGRIFYLAPFLFTFNRTDPSPGYLVKVVCSAGETVIYFHISKDEVTNSTCNSPGDFYQVFIESYRGLYLHANRPILVAQMFASTKIVSPSMVVIPPVEKYNSMYVFPTARSDPRRSFVHYLQITVPSNETDGIYMDNEPLSSAASWHSFDGDLDFVWASFEIIEGIHTIYHKLKSQFGAVIVGHSKLPRYCSYAYPAGMCS